MKIRPAAAGIAAAALLVGSAGLAAASSDPTPVRTLADVVKTQSADVGQQTYRLSGNDRYETSVEVSKDIWTPEDTVAVFLATGEGYADALSAGASTLGSGPLLLTGRSSLPPVVAAEIQRLKPCGIIVVGGPSAVSDQVALQADALADSSGTKCGA